MTVGATKEKPRKTWPGSERGKKEEAGGREEEGGEKEEDGKEEGRGSTLRSM